MKELITLVNENDEVIGYEEKLYCHEKSILHRAFSIFIYNEKDNTLLIQHRAKGKYHSGGVWSNSCCSHQRKGETMEDALSRCIREELTLHTKLTQNEKTPDKDFIRCLGKFKYYADFGNNAEHEIDNVFLYVIPQEKLPLIKAVEAEIEEIKWLTTKQIDEWLSKSPEDFSAWFQKAYNFVKTYLAEND